VGKGAGIARPAQRIPRRTTSATTTVAVAGPRRRGFFIRFFVLCALPFVFFFLLARRPFDQADDAWGEINARQLERE